MNSCIICNKELKQDDYNELCESCSIKYESYYDDSPRIQTMRSRRKYDDE